MSVDGQQVGIKTSAIEEKCQAFETLVVYASTLGARFAPYLPQSLELVLPGLKFFFHEGVREACAVYVFPGYPKKGRLSSDQQSNTGPSCLRKTVWHAYPSNDVCRLRADNQRRT